MSKTTIRKYEDYIKIEVEHGLINIWFKRDPVMIQVKPDRGYAGEPDYSVRTMPDLNDGIEVEIYEPVYQPRADTDYDGVKREQER